MHEKNEGFAVPSAPEAKDEYGERSQRLTNADFRKLYMTPRSASQAAPTPTPSTSRETVRVPKDNKSEDRAEQRRRKKSFYAKLKKQEDDKMAELALKYRDRASERRSGANPDYQNEDPMSAAGGYRAVAPDVKSTMDAAERRRQMIQESKFLGGDMEHTHLVKGLDYALLQKVRSEIHVKEQEEEEEIEQLATKKDKKDDSEEVQFKTVMGRNIYKTLFKPAPLERNEQFAAGRMAYVIDLEDDYAESDIPTTLVRSKAEFPGLESQATLTTNDIVINKLAQILTYLRQGNRMNKKGKKKEVKTHTTEEKPAHSQRKNPEDSIYGDIGDYIPTVSKRSEKDKERRKDRDKDRRDSKRSYFEKPADDERKDRRDLEYQDAWSGEARDRSKELAEVEERTFGSLLKRDELKHMSKAQKLLSKLTTEPEGYAECYPGFDEMQDAIEDSDEEVDYTKMDMGNKKGPIGRWDFDTQEEYSEYMNNKEALPKAAFQYGLKMADGRRTRKFPKEKNEKAELDREWQKIQSIIHKRKAAGGDPGVSERKVARLK